MSPVEVSNAVPRAGDQYQKNSRLHEYTSSANPDMPKIPVLAHDPELHRTGATRIIPFDLSETIGTKYPASSPNLMASYIRICENESIDSQAVATSQAFYIIRGEGKTVSEFGEISWSEGDMVVLPNSAQKCTHSSTTDSAIYWVSDEPLMNYLGVSPTTKKFEPTVFRKQQLLDAVELVKHEPGAEHRNRIGVLLGNETTDDSTKTLTHVLWSLLNLLPPGDNQRPHRHNSVALDFCVGCGGAPGKVYTLMGPELDEEGWVKDPIKVDWATGGMFITPPGWWHSHHNETDEPAWVLPVQDAGLYTYQRTLDIRFSTGPTKSDDDEQAKKKQKLSS